MAVVSTMILSALRMTGEKGRGDTLTSTEAVQCLDELNVMLETWQTERLMCYTLTQQSTTLTASTASYTIGTNGAFAVARPTKIVDPCFVRDSSGADTPVKVIDAATYGALVSKGAGYTVPTHLYYDAGYSATSTGSIYVYPSPSANLTLFINSWGQLNTFSTISATAMFPPGYQAAIEANYAVRSALGLREISTDLKSAAKQTKAAIKSLNIPDTVMEIDTLPIYETRSNILTGP